MNRPLRHSTALPRTTTAAEGMPRRAFTVTELEEMTAARILLEDERIELIGGDVVPMSPKGNQHELVKTALTHYWSARRPKDVTFSTETTFRFTTDTFLEPDFVFYPVGGLKELSAEIAKLVVEIADSSLRYDLGRKAELYSRFGILELWVIDAIRLDARIHTEPTITGYRSVVDLPPTVRLTPTLIPSLAVTLSELDIS